MLGEKMALLSSKTDKDIHNQIQILATNLEILNQKLHQNPDAAISPGEVAIRDSLDEVQKEMVYVKNVLKSTQMDVQNTFKTEKETIAAQVQKMNKATQALGKFDKDYLNALMSQLQSFNNNAEMLNKSLDHYSSQMYRVMDTQRAAITKTIYQKLFRGLKKDNLVMMGFTTLMSSVVALIVLMGLLYFIK
jgi:hypothetical protein